MFRGFGVRVLASLGKRCYQVMLYLLERALSSKAKGSFPMLANRNLQPAKALSSKAKGSFLILATRNRQLPLTLLLNFLTAENV